LIRSHCAPLNSYRLATSTTATAHTPPAKSICGYCLVHFSYRCIAEARTLWPFFPNENGARILYPHHCNRRNALIAQIPLAKKYRSAYSSAIPRFRPFVAFCDELGKNRRTSACVVEWRGRLSAAMMRMELELRLWRRRVRSSSRLSVLRRSSISVCDSLHAERVRTAGAAPSRRAGANKSPGPRLGARRSFADRQPRNAICSVTICVRSGFFSPWTSSLNLSTLLDQFIEQNFGPHIEQKAASL